MMMHVEQEIEHAAERPAWTCAACGAAWPCAPAKVNLAERYQGERLVDLMLDLSLVMDRAIPELPGATRAELYDRFVLWVR